MPQHILWYPNLAAELARRDLTHASLAEAIGCSAGTITHVLRGRLAPSAELQDRVAKALGGLNVDRLFEVNPEVRHILDALPPSVPRASAEQFRRLLAGRRAS